jgi:hypothetical protein
LSSTEVIQRVAAPALQVEIPTAAATTLALQMEIPMVVAVPALQVEIRTVVVAASSPDPSVGEEGHQANLDATVVADASSLNLKPATREVH